MVIKLSEIPLVVIRGLVLSLLYFYITKANDTTINNVFIFVTFYTIFTFTAISVKMNPDVVTTAFLTKTIFTLIDERIKKHPENNK